MRLGKSRCGCYIGNIFCGALSYADDVIILAPTMSSVYSMLSICEKFANDYDVIFNASKSNLLIFPASFDGQYQYENISVHFMGGTIAYRQLRNGIQKKIGKLKLVLCLGWNVRLIVSLPRRYDVMTLRKPIVTWYVKTFRNVNYVC